MYVSIFLWVFVCIWLWWCVWFIPAEAVGQICVNPLFQTSCGCSPPCCHQSQLNGQSYPLSFILTHEHTRSQVREHVRGAGAEVGKPPLFKDDKHLCKPSKQPLSFSFSVSKLSNSSTPTAAWTAVCLTPPKTSIQASTRDKSKWEIHHHRKSGLIKALHGSSKYDHCLGRKVLRTAPLRMSWESRDCSLSKG